MKNQTSFQEGNPGRPKGAKNKLTRDIEYVIKTILNATTDKDLQNIVKKLKKNKPEIILNFIAKIAPKDIKLTGDITQFTYDLSKLSIEEVQKLKEMQEKLK